MTEFALSPAFIEIQYHSAYGPHVMTRPIKAYTPPSGSFTYGSVLNWNSVQRDVDEMVNDFAELMAGFLLTTSTIDSYTVYTQADENSSPVPQVMAALAIPGTNTGTFQAKAVETTFSIRTDGFHQAKLVLLDAPAPNSFDKINTFSTSPEALAIFAELKDADNGWCGRDNERFNTLVQITYTLNETLRRRYGMT